MSGAGFRGGQRHVPPAGDVHMEARVRVLFAHRQVVEGRRVDHHVGPVRLDEIAHRSRVGHVRVRARHPGEKGLYTWWSQRGGARAKNVGWRIDIFLVSKDLVPAVTDAAIHPDVKGSDHCPVSLTLAV